MVWLRRLVVKLGEAEIEIGTDLYEKCGADL